MTEKITEIKNVEERRLMEFPLYNQTRFESNDSTVFVELERKRKDSDDESVIKKVCQIIYDLNSRCITNAFDPLESSMRSYKKAFYVHKDESEDIEYISDGFNAIMNQNEDLKEFKFKVRYKKDILSEVKIKASDSTQAKRKAEMLDFDKKDEEVIETIIRDISVD